MNNRDRLNIVAIVSYYIGMGALFATGLCFIYNKPAWVIPTAFLTVVALVTSRTALYYKQFFDQDSD